MNKILDQAKAYEGELIRHRRDLHASPELGFYLPETAKYVSQVLTDFGIDHRPCGKITKEITEKFAAAGFVNQSETSGIVATVGSGEPCILLRADMDALPIQELTGLEFASTKPGHMHACGHDAHTAMLLTAAKILKDRESELKGTVKFMFQTGEELGYGSKLMIDDGLLENPKVSVAMAIHVMSDYPSGEVHYVPNIVSSSMDTWMIEIQGKGGHSSMPHQAIDPVLIASQLTNALNLLLGREAPPSAHASLTVGSIQSGTVPNIIPDTASVKASMRTMNLDVQDHLSRRVEELIEHYVTAWRGSYTFTKFFTPSTFADEAFINSVLPHIKEVVAEEFIKQSPPMSGSEDFGYVTREVPGMFLILGAGHKGAFPMHNPNMLIDESVLHLGSALYANVALRWLEDQV